MASADDRNKGVMGSNVTMGVGDDVEPETKRPLLPLRVVLVADLLPADEFNAGASAPPHPFVVDLHRFDELFSALRPRIAIDVPSVLANGRPVRVDIAPTSLKSLRPDGLCADLPLLRSLLDGRVVLERLRDGALGGDQARAELARLWGGSAFVDEIVGGGSVQPTATPPSSGVANRPPVPPTAQAKPPSGSIDSILEMVDLSGSPGSPMPGIPSPAPAATASSKFSELIHAIVGTASRTGSIRPADAIARLDRAIGVQIGAILQHPEVRRLEQSWRGLRFLVERAKNHDGIRLEVVSARADDAPAALAAVVRSDRGAAPVSFAVVDLTVDGSALSFRRLEALADVGEEHTMPILVNGSPGLLGLTDLSGIANLDHPVGLFEAPARAPWRSSAAKASMRWVSIAMNSVLGRTAYDASTSRIRTAQVEEMPNDARSLVWLPPAWIVAALVVNSFRETGWPCRIVGVRGAGVVGDLTVREIPSTSGDEAIAIPTETLVTTETQRDFGKVGVLLLAAAANSDAVYLLGAPTAYVPPPKRAHASATSEPEARPESVSLVDQLFVARLAQFLRTFCSKIPAQSEPDELGAVVEGALWALFETAPPAGPEIRVQVRQRQQGSVAEVQIRPRRFLGVGLDEVGLEVPIG